MNSVIAFPAERLKPADTAARRGGAEIVIFPGVRIERREFNLADRVAPRRRRAARALEQTAEDA